MEVEAMKSGPRPCLLRRRLQMMGILSIKKRHRHRLSIQSVSPGLPNTLLIRKKPPTIEKRSKVWVPLITLSFEPELVERDEPAPHFLTFEPKPQLEMEFKNLNNSVESYVTVQGRRRCSSTMKAAELKIRVEKECPGEEGFGDWGRRVDYRVRGGSKGKGRSSAVGRCSLLGRVQTGLKGGGIQDSDLTGDSSLARALESKHGHLQLREEGTVDRRLTSRGICQLEQEVRIIKSQKVDFGFFEYRDFAHKRPVPAPKPKLFIFSLQALPKLLACVGLPKVRSGFPFWGT
ncbi:unnamed protein product [Dovyalis caffra]|uniref:Uncharacterized protein n=1 Tax=Dovyalis caffra TaxID=77055 RepID=A0AAV1R6N4_9ROSI|nr:unnamed protein product [Dovyalis caffra]